MKKLLLVFAIALFSFNVSAAEKPVKPNESLRNEIVNLLRNSLTYDSNQNQFTVEVIFTVNNNGELIIISTTAPNKLLEKTIKKKLNYKKVNFKASKRGEMYLLPLTIKNS